MAHCMREGCPTARLIVLAAALAVASLLPTSLLASKLIPVVPAWFPEINHGPILIHGDAHFTHATRITVTNNAILSGLDLDSSTNVTVQGNTFVYGGITWHGSSPTHFSSHVITSDNLAQGKPIRYYAGCVDQVIDATGAGQVLVADCDRVHISNLTAVDPNGYRKAAIQL